MSNIIDQAQKIVDANGFSDSMLLVLDNGVRTDEMCA